MTRSALVAMLVCACASTGCRPPPFRTGRALRSEDVRAVVPDRTTKAQLFAVLGPPNAIAGAGEVVRAASVKMLAHVGGDELEPHRFDGSYPVQGDALLELFADDIALGPDHRVYEFRAHEEQCTGSRSVARSRYVWVLVDETTERVVAVRSR
jgi:hypothetical protein